jgi:hypothetical protein
MVTKRRGLLGLMSTGVAAVLVLAKSSETRAASVSQAAPSIVGTWVTAPPPGQTGVPQRVQATFGSDGTVIVTTNFFPRQSPAQGVWEQIDNQQQFAATWMHLRYDDTGSWVGITKVRQTITLNEALDESVAVVVAEDLDHDGNVLATRRPTVTSHRMRVEPVS